MRSYNLKNPNRDEQTKPKMGKFYCTSCDTNWVGKGEKCNVCGEKTKTKRRKK